MTSFHLQEVGLDARFLRLKFSRLWAWLAHTKQGQIQGGGAHGEGSWPHPPFTFEMIAWLYNNIVGSGRHA